MPTLVTIQAAGVSGGQGDGAGAPWERQDHAEAVDLAARATNWDLADPLARVWDVDGTLLVSWLADDAPPLPLFPTVDALTSARSVTFADLAGSRSRVGRAVADRRSRRLSWRWRAISPTTFDRRGLPDPAPDPAALLISVGQAWNDVAPEEFAIAPDLLAQAARQTRTLWIEGRTAVADRTQLSGFVGIVDAVVEDLEARQAEAVRTVLSAADFLGAGLCADQGMGATAVEVSPDRSSGADGGA